VPPMNRISIRLNYTRSLNLASVPVLLDSL
jgi:hypothetical protein